MHSNEIFVCCVKKLSCCSCFCTHEFSISEQNERKEICNQRETESFGNLNHSFSEKNSSYRLFVSIGKTCRNESFSLPNAMNGKFYHAK